MEVAKVCWSISRKPATIRGHAHWWILALPAPAPGHVFFTSKGMLGEICVSALTLAPAYSWHRGRLEC